MELLAHEKDHLSSIYPYLGECTLLLKKNGDFPLKEVCEIALYGSGGRRTIKGGTGSGEVNSRFFVDVLQGLKNRGFTVLTESWLDLYDQVREKLKKEFVKRNKEEAKKAHQNSIMALMGKVMPEGDYDLPLEKKCETAVYVLSRISGEGSDRENVRGDYLLSNTEIRDIQRLHELYDRFLLVINAGGPVDLSEVGFVDNILVLSQLGVETGNALADLLLGKLYPSGKLATTWDSYDNYCHEGDFAKRFDTSYKEGIYVGYRYFDSIGKKPLYPFGFGLGYADFEYEINDVSLDGDSVSVKVRVNNVSKDYCGKEVVQLYLSKPQGKLDQPYQELCAFAKSQEIAPGRSEELKLSFALRDFASYDCDRQAYVLEKGTYVIRVGTSSADNRIACVLDLETDVIVRQVKNVLGDPGFKDLRIERENEIVPLDVKRFVVDPVSIETENTDYLAEDPICRQLKDCGAEELSLLNIGAFDPKGSILSVIGSAAMSVAGAAGETSAVFKDRGLRNIVLSDGPAGLRIARQYYRDEKGAHSIGISLPETIFETMPKLVKWIISRSGRAPKDAEVFEQWCTAIPIGTAIAQSFNRDFACLLGDIVGKEMEIYGVDLWLAPALNIHRDVLCGRNFEYFSEDPFVSGVMAAGITRGVQSHPGKGVTIKHFAANNQETNRYGNNSLVSERAMREIYLRGFEYCVKKEKPYALMSSYNLLNGTHTSEHKGLCVDILRREWGFEGIVMTDWVVSMGMSSKDDKYPSPDPAKVADASHSLFMPGSKKDYEALLDGLKHGRVSLQQLKVNGSRLFKYFGK